MARSLVFFPEGIIIDRAGQMKSYTVDQMGPLLALNVAIAVEHIILREVDFGLGTCWIKII
jgi:hypothetical protein